MPTKLAGTKFTLGDDFRVDRSVVSLASPVSVRAFGAKGDGVTDDTEAIQSAINAGQTADRAVFVPAGRYRITAPLEITQSRTAIIGEDSLTARLETPNDIDMIRVDCGTGYRDFVTISGLWMEYTGGSPSAGSAIRMYDSTGLQAYGGSWLTFDDLVIRYPFHGIVFDKAKLGLWEGVASIADYGHVLIRGLRFPYNAGQTRFGVLFKGGPGAHNIFADNDISAATACIRMGDGTGDGGVGDQLFVANHLIDAQYAIDLIGPTTANRYNQNVVITGCQFDGITVATVRASNMSNFRIVANNSTAAAGLSLTTCTNYLAEDRGAYTFTGGLRVPASTTAVNQVQVTGSAAGAGAVTVGAAGSDTNIGIWYSTKGSGEHTFWRDGTSSALFNVTGAASCVNYLQARGAITANLPVLRATGPDADVGVQFQTKGGGTIWFQGDLGASTNFMVLRTASAVNYVAATGAALGSPPQLTAQGSDTDIDVQLTPKGAGRTRIGSAWTSSGDVAVNGYVEVKSSDGTVRKLATIA